MPQVYTIADDMKENEISVDEGILFPTNPEIAQLATSTPLPLLARGHRVGQEGILLGNQKYYKDQGMCIARLASEVSTLVFFFFFFFFFYHYHLM